MSTQLNDQAEATKAVVDILKRIEDSVRKVDYEAVRDLIPDDGLYFGSVATSARGYDELYERQFTKVWPNVRDFEILAESVAVKSEGKLAWATCLFRSGGTDPQGQAIERQGRMTFVFERRAQQWVIVHSHDSLFPGS